MSVFHPAFPMKVQYSKGKIVGSLLLGFLLLLMFFVVLYGIYTHPSDDLDPRMLVLKYLGPLVGILLLAMQVFYVIKLFSNEPKMIVDEEGIKINDPKYGFFAWKDLVRVMATERQVSLTRKIPLLVLVPRDMNAALSRMSGYRLRIAQSNMKSSGGLTVVMQNIAGDPREITGAISEYAQQQISENVIAPPVAIV